MFQNWGFLLGEIWVLLLIAALLGLFCGWLIWGGRCKRCAERDGTTKKTGSATAAASTGAATASAQADKTAHASGNYDYDRDGKVEGTSEGTKPAMLSGPRASGADDLKRIKGIGPKLEELCHHLGVYHFDQIAAWDANEVAWMDSNLEGFYGRVSRDDWVGQAKILAAGGETEFSKRVAEGEVY